MMKLSTLLLALAITVAAQSQPSTDIINYINTYKQLAMEEMQRTGVPASITLAQGIHETYAGKSDLVLKSNNHFGIKCKNTWSGDKVYHDDDARGECFRSYPSPVDSYRDHSDFLKGSARYAPLFTLDATDYKAWAYGLKKAGYATNIRYSQILIKLIEEFNLQQYTLIAMGRVSPSEEQVAQNPKPLEQIPGDVVEVTTEKQVEEVPALPAVQYPTGEFRINNTRVIFAKKGTSLLSLAQEYELPLAKILDFNDIGDEVLDHDQLIFLQRKRKSGSSEFHTVRSGETLYDVCQAEGIRLESLLDYNFLQRDMQPAAGEKLYLQYKGPGRPSLVQEKVDAKPLPTETSGSLPTSTHIVQTSETLYGISRKYGVDVERLKEWNKLDSTHLKVGQELVIHKN